MTAKRPSILFNAIPKSGSSYITDMLIRGLQAKRIFVTAGIFPGDLILFDRIQTLSGGNQVAQQHFGPSPANLAYLRKFRVPLILHVRDPRAVMVSWTHHLSAAQGGLDELFWYYPAICPPEQFLSRDFSWKLEWCIEHHLRHFLAWLQEWCDAIDQGDAQAHVTSYEQFLDDRDAFFRGILRYAGIPPSDFNDPRSPPGAEHLFRKGEKGEWRTVLNETTARRISEAIPAALAARFCWT